MTPNDSFTYGAEYAIHQYHQHGGDFCRYRATQYQSLRRPQAQQLADYRDGYVWQTQVLTTFARHNDNDQETT